MNKIHPIVFIQNAIFYSVLFFVLTAVISCTKSLKNKNANEGLQTAGVSLQAAASNKKANIIFIIGDDVGYEIPTYNGGTSYSTPNLDFMAANGMQFNHFYSHPDGSPSRLAALTGKYSFRNYTAFAYLPPDSKTFANMLQDAGYNTCYVGKWQEDGGDASIHRGGFANYRVFLPYQPKNKNDNDQFYRRYKNPLLYEKGAYLPDAAVEGKYSEDLMCQYAAAFIDSNKTKPFLLYYSCNLVQKPWSPTPDDADFAGWNPATDDVGREDKKYFPSMVTYMDKTIGKIIAKVNADGLTDNTIIIFTGDNGTSHNITSGYKGRNVKGGKNLTNYTGINVPLVCYGAAKILKGVTDTSLADMTDFLPTFADIASIPKPAAYKPLDGVSFADNLIGAGGQQRTTVFCHWQNFFADCPGCIPLYRYCFDYNYKLYDTVNNSRFFNIIADPNELTPLTNDMLTQAQINERNKLQAKMNALK